MVFTIFSVFYVLIAIAMIVLILIQRGEGADAGASFGGGSSGTVFGARGSASFLTRATAVLAAVFFALTLGMGVYLSHHGVAPSAKQSLGVMAGAASSAPAKSAPAKGAPAGSAPANAAPAAPASAPHSEVPAAPTTNSAVPAAPRSSTPAGAPSKKGGEPSASH